VSSVAGVGRVTAANRRLLKPCVPQPRGFGFWWHSERLMEWAVLIIFGLFAIATVLAVFREKSSRAWAES